MAKVKNFFWDEIERRKNEDMATEKDMTYATEQGILNSQWNAALEANITEIARRAPHILLKPDFALDGNQYSFLYGGNIAEGISGYGDTPEKAAADFDKNWRETDATKRKFID